MTVECSLLLIHTVLGLSELRIYKTRNVRIIATYSTQMNAILDSEATMLAINHLYDLWFLHMSA